MNKLGTKIAEKRKSLGMTQIDFAEKMHVTRQTVSRWEAGTAMPDIDKIGEIADLLGTSCDYLLKDEAPENSTAQTGGVGRLLRSLTGKTVQLSFFDGDGDYDLFNTPCRILEFDGDWILVRIDSAKGSKEKLIRAGSVQGIRADS